MPIALPKTVPNTNVIIAYSPWLDDGYYICIIQHFVSVFRKWIKNSIKGGLEVFGEVY